MLLNPYVYNNLNYKYWSQVLVASTVRQYRSPVLVASTGDQYWRPVLVTSTGDSTGDQ